MVRLARIIGALHWNKVHNVVFVVFGSGFFPEVWKRTSRQPHCCSFCSTNPWKEQLKKPLLSHSAMKKIKVGQFGPLAVLQSLMPSISLNGFFNPSSQFHSSLHQTVFRLLSPPVINPFISKRSDQCCLGWELPCQGTCTGKICRPRFGQRCN